MIHRDSIIRIAVSIALLATFGYVGYRFWRTIHQEAQQSFDIDVNTIYRQENIVPVAIVGSGPAGFAAAMYAARGAMHTVIFEGDLPGGQLMTTSWVENWPAIARKLGSDIMHDAREQAKAFGAQTVQESITHVDTNQWPYILTTSSGKQIKAMTLIWATGSTPRTLGVPGEQKYWGKGVTTCAICDAPFHNNNRVCVVGGGDSAVEEALELAPHAREVIIMVRRNTMRATPVMQKRLEAYDHIHVWYNTQITEIAGDTDSVTKVTINRDNTKETIPMDGVFLAIGHDPNTKLLQDIVETDARGYITVQGRSQRTGFPGVFAAGDVEDPDYKQAGVAAGSGIKAALDAAEFLRTIGYNEQIEKTIADRLYDPEIASRLDSVTHIETIDQYKQRVLNANKPVLVDFYTQQCPSCLRMMPDFEYVAARFADSVDCYKVDALQAAPVAQFAQVKGVPRILIYRNGTLERVITRALSRSELVDVVQKETA